MKKFNWGHGILVFYVCFVCTLIFVVYASTKVDRSLVIDNYYSQDLAYQSVYNKIENGFTDSLTNIEFDARNQKVIFHLAESSEGKIQFYRPSDKSMDFEILMDQANMELSTSPLAEGLWIIKLEYMKNKKAFYKETKLYL